MLSLFPLERELSSPPACPPHPDFALRLPLQLTPNNLSFFLPRHSIPSDHPPDLGRERREGSGSGRIFGSEKFSFSDTAVQLAKS